MFVFVDVFDLDVKYGIDGNVDVCNFFDVVFVNFFVS